MVHAEPEFARGLLPIHPRTTSTGARLDRHADDVVFAKRKVIGQFLRQMGGVFDLRRGGPAFGNDPAK